MIKSEWLIECLPFHVSFIIYWRVCGSRFMSPSNSANLFQYVYFDSPKDQLIKLPYVFEISGVPCSFFREFHMICDLHFMSHEICAKWTEINISDMPFYANEYSETNVMGQRWHFSSRHLSCNIIRMLSWVLILKLEICSVEVIIFFNWYLATPRPTLGHYQGGSPFHSMLVTAFLQFRPEGYWEPRNEVGSLSLAMFLNVK